MMNSGRRTYTLTQEPTGTLYGRLLRWGARTGKQLVLVVRQGLDLSPNGRRVLDRLEPYLLAKDCSSRWPGTVLLDGEAEVMRFRLTESAVGILTEASSRLYAWQQPELPEDLGLLHPDGSPCLVSIAHEEDAYLVLTDEERKKVTVDLSELTAILDTNPGELGEMSV